MTTQTEQSMREKLLVAGLELAPMHGVHHSAVADAVDQVLTWHNREDELVDEDLLMRCLEGTMEGMPSACDVLVPILARTIWTEQMSIHLAGQLLIAGFDHILVTRSMGFTIVSLRLPGNLKEVTAEAYTKINAVVRHWNMQVVREYIKAEIVPADSTPDWSHN